MSSVLCVDVGATRIKAAILPRSLSIEALEGRSVFAMRSLGWLNSTLPELLSAENWAGVVGSKSFGEDFSEVAIGVPGAVKGGRFLRGDLDVPIDLKDQFSRFTDKKVTLVKDADAWMVGATAYSQVVAQDLGYPAIALILGTGVGLSMTRDGRRFDSLEISALSPHFPSLAEASGVAIERAWQVHDILGKSFFSWVAAEKKHWSYPQIRAEFSKRVISLVEDLPLLIGLNTSEIKTISVGGGNSEYVSVSRLRSETNCDVQILSNRTLRIDPDLVPLLGLHRIVHDRDVHVES